MHTNDQASNGNHPQPGTEEAMLPHDWQLAASLSENVYCELHHWGLLTINGEDASNFLQGQITQDVKRVDELEGGLAAHCSPKGRMLGLFRLISQDGGFGLLLHRDMLPALRQRLQLYVLRSRVQIADRSDEIRMVGFSGPAIDSLPGIGDHQRAGLRSIRLPGHNIPRWLVLGESARIGELLAEIGPQLTQVGSSGWRLLDILDGVPSLYPATRDQFVPQMLNLDALGGISFKKGCYTGQEIVARSHYLGKIKRRMFRLNLAGSGASAGMAVYSEADPGQPAGMVVDAAPHPEGGEALLAVLRLEAVQSGLHLAQADGPLLSVGELPYTLPQAAA